MNPKIELNEKFQPLWTTDCFITLVTGGRGSGKSFAVGDFTENLSFEQGHKILFTRFTLDSASDSIIPEFEEKIDREGHDGHFYVTKKDVINRSSGSEILFRGIKTSSGNQTAKLKSIEGLTTWVLDEAEELVEEATFNVIAQSIRKKGIQNRIILVLNPKSKDHWIYKRFFENLGEDPKFNGEKDGVCYIHTTYLENLDNLSPEFIAEAEKCKRLTPEIYAYDYLGEWVLSIEGALFKLDQLKRYKQINEEGVSVCAIDTADKGNDHFAAPFGKLLGNYLYITDAIFNLTALHNNKPVCAERFTKHKVDQAFIETNAAGSLFMENLKEENPTIPIWGKWSSTNKMGRILAQVGWILEFCYFPENPNEELSRFIIQMCSITHESKEDDDAADSICLLAEMVRKHYLGG